MSWVGIPFVCLVVVLFVKLPLNETKVTYNNGETKVW
jgi:hypothetical protein